MTRKGKYMPIWGRYVDSFDVLSPSQLGKLVHAMMHYYFDDREPKLTGLLLFYWGLVKQELDDARQSYEKKLEGSRRGGERSAQVRREGKEVNASDLKVPEGTLREVQVPQPITITESITKTITESISKTETESESDDGSAPAVAGISVSERAYGDFSGGEDPGRLHTLY